MNIFKCFKENLKLKEELRKKEAIINEMMKRSTPELVVEKVLGEPLKFEDISKRSKDYRRNCYAEAQNILNSEIFNNVANKYIVELVDGIAKRSKSYEEVVALRYTLNGVQMIKERLGKIENPDALPGPTKKNVHNPV